MAFKLRAQQITIETPKEGAEPWVHVVVQRVEFQGENIRNTIDRYDTFSKRLSEIAAEVVPYISATDGYINAYELSRAVSAFVIKWLIEKYGGEVQANGDLVIS